jgi:hypothetical protein
MAEVQRLTAPAGFTDEEKRLIAKLFSTPEGKRVLEIIERETIRKGIPPVLYQDGQSNAMAAAFRNGENNLALRLSTAGKSLEPKTKSKNP